MRVNKKIAAAALAGGAVAIGAAGIAVAGSDDDGSDTPITGAALEKASAAALEVTGGGEVTETEVGDEEGAYEVEVTQPDGSQTDVHLDEQFNPIGSQADDESESGEER
jgi:uncharacterized membrane protein YkoI